MRRYGWLGLLGLLGAGPVGAAPQLVEQAVGDSYRLSGELSAPPAALAAGRARLIFDYTDERNYGYLDLRGDEARFHLVRDGRDTPLGQGGPLYRGRPTDPLVWSLHRREWQLIFLCNKVVAARAEAHDLPPGAVGHEVTAAGVQLTRFEVQPTDEIYFADDFMRSDDQLGGWEPLQGKWANNQQGSKSSRSANAFSFRSLGQGESLVAAGYPFWTEYMHQAAVRADGAGAVGLIVGLQDPQHYLRLRWTSERHPDGGTLRFQRVFGGQVTDLTPPLPGGFKPRVWYKLQVGLAGGRLFAWIDDTPRLEAAEVACGEGRIGLWTEPGVGDDGDSAGALFDDVLCRTWPVFLDDFSHPSEQRWEPVGGTWRPTSGPAGAVAAEGAGRLLCGPEDWEPLVFEARLRADSGTVGTLLNMTAAGGYAVRSDGREIRLLKLTGDRAEVLDRRPGTLVDGRWHRVQTTWERGLLRARIDGQPALEGFDLEHPAGRCGFLVEGARGALFDDARALFRPTFWRLPPTVPADFASDQYMVNWASPAAAWIQVEGSPARWHKGFFYGDRSISLRLPRFGQQTGRVELVLGATATDGGDVWRLRLTLAREEPRLTVALLHGETPVAEVKPAVEGDEPELLAEVRGRFILLWIDGTLVLQQAVEEARP